MPHSPVPKTWLFAFGLLAAQAVLVHWAAAAERPPAMPDLSRFPRQIEDWKFVSDDPLQDDVLRQLGADRVLSRTYVSSASNEMAQVLVVWFQTQRTGARQPHSPKVCLPGAGWIPEETADVAIPTASGEILVNRMIIRQQRSRAVVLYWYQTPRRVIAGEWEAKFWVAADALRDRRTDTALVRVLVWPLPGREAQAVASATDVARNLYPRLRAVLPGNVEIR